MSELRELYQQMIIDHGRAPRNFRELESATDIKDGFNPLCGDKLTVYIQRKNGAVVDISFQGCGCAISQASASMMTEFAKGKTTQEIETVFQSFHDVVTTGNSPDVDLGKLAVLAGVAQFPSRVKCATLAWHTLIAAINKDPDEVSTE